MNAAPQALVMGVVAFIVTVGFAFVVQATPHAPRSVGPASSDANVGAPRSLPSFIPAAKPPRLALPRDVAVDVTRSSNLGNSADLSDPGIVRVYRLRASGDVVFLTPRPDGPLAPTVGLQHVNRVVRGETFEVASRTLDIATLAKVADLLQ